MPKDLDRLHNLSSLFTVRIPCLSVVDLYMTNKIECQLAVFQLNELVLK